MSKIIHPLKLESSTRRPASTPSAVRKPHYDCTEHLGAISISIYLPEVDPIGVEIVVRGTDLIVTGRRRHVVRVNWTSLQLEKTMLDYELRLRLGTHLNYTNLTADLQDGLLTLVIPKKELGRSARRAA